MTKHSQEKLKALASKLSNLLVQAQEEKTDIAVLAIKIQRLTQRKENVSPTLCQESLMKAAKNLQNFIDQAESIVKELENLGSS